jgi:NADH:ubiquinone oxidoreductase subunit 5 (subunit L)/multisubunit Na+/H+ antiporter MnhA subunit
MYLNTNFKINFDFLIDNISLSFSFLTLTIAIFVYVYTFSYFRYEVVSRINKVRRKKVYFTKCSNRTLTTAG